RRPGHATRPDPLRQAEHRGGWSIGADRLPWCSVTQEARKYLIRTFGCQMNEHDSERLAGLLEADGMEATADVDQADVVMLNTCCIRENADNRVYGNLGQPKSLKQRRPDLQIAVGD